MKLFFDHNVGSHVPRALRLLRVDATWHLEHFAPTAPDAEWLPVVGSRGWVVVTHDRRLLLNPTERRAIYDARVGCFILHGGGASRWEKMRILSAAWPMMAYVMENEPPPYIWRLLPSGRWERG